LRNGFLFGKSFHVTGWKVGYLVAPEYLMKEIKSTSVSGFQCQQSMPGSNKRVFGCGFDGIGSMYQEKRDYSESF
jgi:methionine aminotransferase